jgi:hypothetical protein
MKLPAVEFALHEVYAAELRGHAIMLIWLGYRRLDPSSLAKADEDEITGVLVREMQSVSEDPASPEWVEQCEVHEQTRQNVEGKSGKGRPIIDLEVRRHHRGSPKRIRFEAKRLGRGRHTIAAYLGDEGLAAFVTGHYPTTHGEAGMLGYFQEKTQDEWSNDLAQKLSDESSKHQVTPNGQLEPIDIEPAMPAFRSCHTDTNGRPLLLIHVLLAFIP